jgi:hypothetical protein
MKDCDFLDISRPLWYETSISRRLVGRGAQNEGSEKQSRRQES